MLLNNCRLTICYMYLYSGSPQVLIRTSALLEMAWYIAIHDHASYCTGNKGLLTEQALLLSK